MTQDDIIEMARQAGGREMVSALTHPNGPTTAVKFHLESGTLEAFAKLVAAKVEARYMQLFLDTENQPTQFGTATQEYREQEIAEIRDLLFALAHRIRTTHLYGPEVKKMLEQEQTIRARGQ